MRIQFAEQARLQVKIVKCIRSVLVENLAGEVEFGKVGAEIPQTESGARRERSGQLQRGVGHDDAEPNGASKRNLARLQSRTRSTHCRAVVSVRAGH